MTAKRILLPEHPPTAENAGRLGRYIEHDERSRNYAYRGRMADVRTVLHSRFVGIMDQQELGSCTGHAGTAALGSDPLYTAAHEPKGLGHDYAVKLYSDATKIDEFDGGYPPDDTGSSGLAIAKVLKARGVISGYSHAFTLDDALAAATRAPVITGITWMSSFDEPDENGFISISSNAYPRGGHEVAIVGIDVDKKALYIANSWGTSWGKGGYCWISWLDFEDLMHDQGDVTVLTPATNTPPASDPDTSLAKAFRAKNWLNTCHVGQTRKVATEAASWLAAKGL